LIMPWRLPAAAARTLPVPVILNRFLAADLVFILGILLSFLWASKIEANSAPGRPSPKSIRNRHGMPCRAVLERALYTSESAKAQQGIADPLRSQARTLSRSEHHHHLAAFELRLGFHLGNLGCLFAHAVEQLHAEFHMRHFAATESQGHLYLVAIVEEPARGLHLGLIVVVVDVRTHLDLFDIDGLLTLARLGGLLLTLIFHLAEIGELANGWFRVRNNFDQAQSGFVRQQQRIVDRNNTAILAFSIDQLYMRDANLEIGARAFLNGRRGFEWSANGRKLLESLKSYVGCSRLRAAQAAHF